MSLLSWKGCLAEFAENAEVFPFVLYVNERSLLRVSAYCRWNKKRSERIGVRGRTFQLSSKGCLAESAEIRRSFLFCPLYKWTEPFAGFCEFCEPARLEGIQAGLANQSDCRRRAGGQVESLKNHPAYSDIPIRVPDLFRGPCRLKGRHIQPTTNNQAES